MIQVINSQIQNQKILNPIQQKQTINNQDQMIQGYISPQVLTLLFLFFGLTIAVGVKKLRSVYSFVPYTPTLFLISVGLGYFSKDLGVLGESIATIAKINPRGILLIFLPPLIFQSGFNSDWYIFRKQAVQIFILAFPAVLVGACLIMVSIKSIIQYDQTYYTWSEAFMFGSVLSCTDTVAVLALLKEAGAPKKFNSLIEGQSLFNDGACMILYTISLQLVKGKPPPPSHIGSLFLQLTLGAIVLGCIFGYLSSQLIAKVRNNPVLTLNITVVSCYLIYFTAQYVYLGIKISGIMALVSLGIYMAAFGKAKIAPEATDLIQHFWKIYVFTAQTIIFILGGSLVGIQFINPEFIKILSNSNVINLLYLYICMTVARFLAIAIFMPKLKKQGYGLRWIEVVALTYGGLRGAVGIAFTLILSSNPNLRPEFRMLSLFNTSGCAFLTLMVNAPTCNYVIRLLGLCRKSQIKIKFFIKFMTQCEKNMIQTLQQMKKNKYLKDAKWKKVQQSSGLIQLQSFISQQKGRIKCSNILSETQLKTLKQNLLSQNIPDTIDPATMEQARNRFCIILKGIFWQKFEDNQCSVSSLRMLTQCVDLDMDSTHQSLNSWDYLISYFHNPYFFPVLYWLKTKPIIGKYAYSWIYDRITLLYEVISTYLQSLLECQQQVINLPYDQYLQKKVIEQSAQNRKLAQVYLDSQLKASYFQIMKRIQTTKASQSILSFQKQIIQQSLKYGQISQTFQKKLLLIIDQCANKLEKDSQYKGQINDVDILKHNQLFHTFTEKDIQKLVNIKVQMFFQNQESIIKPYEKQKHMYFITRGQVAEEYKIQGRLVYKRIASFGQLAGVGILLMNHRKQLQYSATAASVVSVFAFPIGQIRQLTNKKPKIQSIFYLQAFMLQIHLQPQLKNKYQVSQQQWLKLKHFTTFKRLEKDEQFMVGDCELIIAYGRMQYKQKIEHKGYFDLRGSQQVKITGPAKLYIIKNPIVQRQSHHSSQIHNLQQIHSPTDSQLNRKFYERNKRISKEKMWDIPSPIRLQGEEEGLKRISRMTRTKYENKMEARDRSNILNKTLYDKY